MSGLVGDGQGSGRKGVSGGGGGGGGHGAHGDDDNASGGV